MSCATEKPRFQSVMWDATGQYLETTGINSASLLGSTTAKFGLLPPYFTASLSQKIVLKIAPRKPTKKRGQRFGKCQDFEARWRLRWRSVCCLLGDYFGSDVPPCHIAQWCGKARPQRESICLPFPLLLPLTCVTSSSLSPPARAKPFRLLWMPAFCNIVYCCYRLQIKDY